MYRNLVKIDTQFTYLNSAKNSSVVCGVTYASIMRQFRCAYAEFDKAGARTESCVGFGVHRVL